MTTPPFDAHGAAQAESLSRRHCLGRLGQWGLAATGLTAPLLQACGGSSNDAVAPISQPSAWSDAESVRWCRQGIQAALARSDSATTAVSVALLADDRVVWSEAFGFANRESGMLATVDMRLNIGSVAKLLATLAVMILRDRGRLTLDQPLVELLPGFSMLSPGFTRITVRQLISHSSGLPGVNDRNLFAFIPILDYAQDTLVAISQSHLKHEPGELAVYCNDGFTLVEPLVRALTGQSFTDFIQQQVFDPLGMGLSGYPLVPLPEGSFVHPYYKGQRTPQEMTSAYATGGAFSTPTDMMKLARLFLDQGMFEGRRIVSAEGIRDMGVDQAPWVRINPTPASSAWGLGWDMVRHEGLAAAGLRAWQKAGDTDFFSTQFFVLPEQRLAVLIVGNGRDYGQLPLSEGLLLRAAKERGAIAALPPVLNVAVPAPAPAPAPANLAELTGVYACDIGPFQIVASGDGSLMLTHLSASGQWESLPGMDTPLRAGSDGMWSFEGAPDLGVRFETVRGHRYMIAIVLSENRFYRKQKVVCERLPPLATPLPDAWRARVGTQWTCVNESPQSLVQVYGPKIGRIGELKELPGYVLWNNLQLLKVVDDRNAGMTIEAPGYAGRDLVELRMVPVQDAAQGGAAPSEELHQGTLVYRRVAASPAAA